MAAAGYLSTPRGEVNMYVYSRTQCTQEHPDDIHNSEESDLDGTENLAGVIQTTLDTYHDAAGWTDSGHVLNYNPKTDTWDIKPGEYVL